MTTKNIRPEVQQFAALGRLPPADADESEISKLENAISRIQAPVTVDEASLLASSFGPDDCCGLAWTLLHLIESAPGGTPITTLPDDDNEWLARLRARYARAQ